MSKKHKPDPIPPEDTPFAPLPYRLIYSPVYEKLSCPAAKAYTLIISRRTHNYQKEISCPYSFACRYMKRDTFARAIKELREAGLIKVRRYGGLYRYCNIYELSNEWATKRL